ncbi:MAG TPA: tRNA lysidine(34) synthetase TilS [Gemmatimonadales bacterium]|nr:tRNA lysidine(34) synthetase TilS [Gemmatimonadales bacterium]
MSLIEAFRAQIASLNLPSGTALVAVSGGPDSVALLDLLFQTQDLHRLDLVVAHVDHGIHPESVRVVEQVRALAGTYRLPVHVGCLALGPGASETQARAARYAWLEALRADLGARIIFTAHHADDQVETVLMRVLVGSGLAGLAGIAPVRGHLIRPLLSVRRMELVDYLEDAGLTAWLDPANVDPRHLRSWIRTELLPALRKRLPRVESSILRMSQQAARDRAAWDAALVVALPELDFRVENTGISVAASSLGEYDSPLAQALILAAARRTGCQLGPARLVRVLTLLQRGDSGKRVPLGGSWIAELAFGRLRIVREPPTVPAATLPLTGLTGQGSWGRWNFRWGPGRVPEHQERTGMTAWFNFDPLLVRAWSPGEKVKPLGGSGRRLVVRCFQELRVPRSKRTSWPVVAHNQEIIWIPGVCRSDVQLPSRGSEALRVDAEYA